MFLFLTEPSLEKRVGGLVHRKLLHKSKPFDNYRLRGLPVVCSMRKMINVRKSA